MKTEKTIPLATGNSCRIEATAEGRVMLSSGPATMHLEFQEFLELCGTMAVAYNRLREKRSGDSLY